MTSWITKKEKPKSWITKKKKNWITKKKKSKSKDVADLSGI